MFTPLTGRYRIPPPFCRPQPTRSLGKPFREADEREEARRVRDFRSRVKAAMAVVATTPGLAETLRNDWGKAAQFYARIGITEGVLRSGVQAREVDVYPPRAQASMPE